MMRKPPIWLIAAGVVVLLAIAAFTAPTIYACQPGQEGFSIGGTFRLFGC